VSVGQRDAEHRSWQHLRYRALKFDWFFFCHTMELRLVIAADRIISTSSSLSQAAEKCAGWRAKSSPFFRRSSGRVELETGLGKTHWTTLSQPLEFATL
jgi:hypothetical protein